MSPTTFLVLGLLAAIATVVTALVHLSRVDDTIVGPAHSGSDAVAPAAETPVRRRGATPFSERLAADAQQLRRPHRRRPDDVAKTDDHDGRALEVAHATRTARLARREQRLRNLGRRRRLTVEEAADLTAARHVLTERGRVVHHDGLPRRAEGVDR